MELARPREQGGAAGTGRRWGGLGRRGCSWLLTAHVKAKVPAGDPNSESPSVARNVPPFCASAVGAHGTKSLSVCCRAHELPKVREKATPRGVATLQPPFLHYSPGIWAMHTWAHSMLVRPPVLGLKPAVNHVGSSRLTSRPSNSLNDFIFQNSEKLEEFFK